jgi:hypothetical protein
MTEQELEQMESNEDGNHPCPKCEAETPNARAVLLRVMTCKDCTRQKAPPKALYESNEREGEGGSYRLVSKVDSCPVDLDEVGLNNLKEENEAREIGERMNAEE